MIAAMTSRLMRDSTGTVFSIEKTRPAIMTTATRSRSRADSNHLRRDLHRVGTDLSALAGTAREGVIDRLDRYGERIVDHPWRSIVMAFAAGMLVAAWMRR